MSRWRREQFGRQEKRLGCMEVRSHPICTISPLKSQEFISCRDLPWKKWGVWKRCELFFVGTTIKSSLLRAVPGLLGLDPWDFEVARLFPSWTLLTCFLYSLRLWGILPCLWIDTSKYNELSQETQRLGCHLLLSVCPNFLLNFLRFPRIKSLQWIYTF